MRHRAARDHYSGCVEIDTVTERPDDPALRKGGAVSAALTNLARSLACSRQVQPDDSSVATACCRRSRQTANGHRRKIVNIDAFHYRLAVRQYMSSASQPSTSTWTVVCVMRK
jgi:hypothetical protein